MSEPTDRPAPGDLGAIELMLADPLLTVEEAYAAAGVPFAAHPPADPGRVVLVPCAARTCGFRVVPAEADPPAPPAGEGANAR